MKRFAWVSWTVALAMTLGCGGPAVEIPELGEVTGTVTVDNKPLEGLSVTFVPESGALASVARTGSDGKYELVYAGWNGHRRIHGSVIHVDVRDGKVWIQHDGTEEGIAERLVSAGIPPDHIVLAFRHPKDRQYTSFAVA